MSSVDLISSRAWTLTERPTVEVKAEHFTLQDQSLTSPEPGEVLVKAKYFAIEPLLRGRLIDRSSYAKPVGIGEVMTGRAISEVVRSKSPDFSQGDLVEHWLGWREYGVVGAADLRKVDKGPWPISTNLGALGSSGLSALLALTKLGRPKSGDTILVTAASGAVGALVVQIAKKLDCRVIGVCGSDAKCVFVSELGADACINYKTDQVDEALAQYAPDGIDVFFDSVGGPIHDAAMGHLRTHARVVIFGTMDFYSNPDRPDQGPRHNRTILVKRATISGFLIRDFEADIPDARKQLQTWWSEGALVVREDIREGIEAAPDALADVIAGRAMGKVLIKVAD